MITHVFARGDAGKLARWDVGTDDPAEAVETVREGTKYAGPLFALILGGPPQITLPDATPPTADQPTH